MFFSGFSHSNTSNSPPSPTKQSLWGSACSPFRNTNVPFTNITMDQTIPIVNGVNIKSPEKSSSRSGNMGGGGPGRTMKDYEDQLGVLKKENFNLKLRIYFLEERMGITSADEDAIRKNIELKVENESLKKELLEKQELLSQAAKAIELIEEQKQESAKSEAQYEQKLEQEREKVKRIEKDLEEYKSKLNDVAYYEETFGMTPEKVLEIQEKLLQSEEIKLSLESELKQMSASLEEERNWAQELEHERDLLKSRLEFEISCKDKLVFKKDDEIEYLKEKIKELEESVFNKEGLLQQLKKEVIEKDRVLSDKCSQLEEKCRAYDEVMSVAEKRKKQTDQLRASIKSRDDALTDLNNKNRSLIAQFENNYAKRFTPPGSPSAFIEESANFRKTFNLSSPTKSFNNSLDFEPSTERKKVTYEFQNSSEKKEPYELRKELDEKDKEMKKQEEIKKQLTLKLYTVQQTVDATDQKYKKLELDHKKAIQMIQGFMKRHDELEFKQCKKNRKIMELEIELSRLKSENTKISRKSINSPIRRNLSDELMNDPERDHNGQRRFEEMECKINDLRDQVDTITAEKNLLEKRINIESEDLRNRLQNKDLKIECLECEKNSIKDELQKKTEDFDKLRESCSQTYDRKIGISPIIIAELHDEKNGHSRIKEKNKLAEVLEESASSNLNSLIKELNQIGIEVTFMNNIIQLNYVNSEKPIDVITVTKYIQRLIAQKTELEKEVDYLKWLKLVSKANNNVDAFALCDSTNERDKQYCELLRTHMKSLVLFMKEMLRNADQHKAEILNNKHRNIVFDIFKSSNLISDDFINALEEIKFETNTEEFDAHKKVDGTVRKSKSENFIDLKNQLPIPSDSEAFSEPDRRVSLERMGISDVRQKSSPRQRSFKFTRTISDSEDSTDYQPNRKNYQSDVNDFEANKQILELKEINSFLYSELNTLKNEIMKIIVDDAISSKISLLLVKLEKSRNYCEQLQSTLEKKMQECRALKKESKQNSVRKLQLEKRMLDIENRADGVTKQKVEVLQYKENTDRKAAEILMNLNKENEMLRSRINKLEGESEDAKTMILRLTRELDHLTLTHSQILVENTKLTNDKLRLEQEVRKSESRYDMTVKTLQEKFHKEVADLNQINESHRVRLQELETTNKQLRRHVVACEASDSAPSSSGISSIPQDTAAKQICDDVMNEYYPYNGTQYWLPTTYPLSVGRSKSSCSPDLGIESDAAATSTRPLKDTLKLTESMTNLLSDEDRIEGLRDLDDDSPLPTEGLDEVQSLKQENIALKKRLMRTRRALEDTFQHLSASNKNKKNVEKAITKQLMITKTILKKTRNFEETTYEN